MTSNEHAGPDHHVLITVQNLSVPLDRRVWQESTTLVRAGFRVSVICPRGAGEASFEELEGVRIHRYEQPNNRGGTIGYLREFCRSWFEVARLAFRVRRTDPYAVLQACNPPDTLWALALFLRPYGVRLVYDQHDLCPEIFAVRFPGRRPVLSAGVRWLERRSYATAAMVVVPNDSYREIARERGRLPEGDVHVVRSGPDPAVMRAVAADPTLNGAGRHLCCYLGIMGPQDGVDLLLQVIDVIVHRRHRTDVHFALLGFGDCLEELRQSSTSLGLDPWVTFTGLADQAMVRRYLSSADLGLCPDPKNPFNDVSTMNKSLEYMAFELPFVAFDLHETRVSGGDAATYVADGDIEGFADAVLALVDDPGRRTAMGIVGRRRIEDELGWPHQSEQYLAAYRHLLGDPPHTDDAQVIDLRIPSQKKEVAR